MKTIFWHIFQRLMKKMRAPRTHVLGAECAHRAPGRLLRGATEYGQTAK